jgi:hypothetical protein
MSSDDLTQQLVDVVLSLVDDVYYDMTPLAQDVVRAVLASGLVVPVDQWDTLAAVSGETMDKYLKLRDAVNDLARQWEREAVDGVEPSDSPSFAHVARLRALI